ncbi:tetratricopeptide repeat protein, partial [Brachyspira pulli]|uniref:tetratricopeptide repeat protein n=1 Tax=Brachyspira pulli TaxID=310721 RepID=UPI0030075655
MLSGIKGYLLKKEIYKIKENAAKINLKEVKEDLIPDAKKSVNKLINFLSKLLLSSSNNNIDDIVKDINSKINAFNNEMNSIMKKSIVIPPMVNVMPDLTEDDFYEIKTFIENINIKPDKYFDKFDDDAYIDDELLDRLILLDNEIDKASDKDSNKDLYKERAGIYNKLSMINYAIEDCDRAIKLDKNDIELKLLKLDIMQKDDSLSHEKIIKCYDDIINLDKTNINSYYQKIDYLKKIKSKEKDIIKCLNNIISLDENNIKALYEIANEYKNIADKTASEENYKKAIEYYNIVKKIDSNYYDTVKNESYCLKKLNFNKELKKSIKYYQSKAEAFFDLERYEEAKNCADKALSLDKEYYLSYFFKGKLLKDIGIKYYEEAIDCFNKVIEIDDKNLDSYYYKGIIYYELKKYKEALKEFDNVIKIDNKNTNCYYYKGLAYYELKKYKEALKEFDNVIKIDNKNCNSYYYKGLDY